jgi:ribose transport system ATP-binding protein
MTDEVILEFKNITKRYPGVTALDDVSFSFKKGEIHALVGENGAGKSTIIKILTGAIRPDGGSMTYEGRDYFFMTPSGALDLKISAIYQEFNLIQYLSVAENIFLGQESLDGIFLDKEKTAERASALMGKIDPNIDVRARVRDLGTAYQQMVEIAKSISRESKLLIMDEPTAPLTNKEVGVMMGIVRGLRDKGVTIIYISHRLEEIFSLCDRVSVLRDGKYICTKKVADTAKQELISLMVGRELSEHFPKSEGSPGDVLLEVKGLSTNFLKDISFKVRRGEVLGFGGLVGAGRTEVARAIVGADPVAAAEILVDGKKVSIKSPNDAIKHGIGLLPEDRKAQGLVLSLSVVINATLASLDKFIRKLFIDKAKERRAMSEHIGEMSIKTPSQDQLAKNLSGGNQQKVVLAKWLATDCEILIFDEPTRGIDVNAKQEIYQIIRRLADSGKAIIMISSEMPELLGMSDNIAVMANGRITGRMARAEATQEKILTMASDEK